MATCSDFFKLQHGRTRGLSSVVPQGRIDGNRDRSFDTTWYVPQIWSIWLTRLVEEHPTDRNQHNWNTNTTTGRSLDLLSCQKNTPKKHPKKSLAMKRDFKQATSGIARSVSCNPMWWISVRSPSHQVPNFPNKTWPDLLCVLHPACMRRPFLPNPSCDWAKGGRSLNIQ